MSCYGLEGTYLDMCNLIAERYYGEYAAIKGGRAPDKGDAVWLVDRGIRTENDLKQFLGISMPLPPIEPPILRPPTPTEPGLPLEKEEKEGKIDPKLLVIGVVVLILLLRR